MRSHRAKSESILLLFVCVDSLESRPILNLSSKGTTPSLDNIRQTAQIQVLDKAVLYLQVHYNRGWLMISSEQSELSESGFLALSSPWLKSHLFTEKYPALTKSGGNFYLFYINYPLVSCTWSLCCINLTEITSKHIKLVIYDIHLKQELYFFKNLKRCQTYFQDTHEYLGCWPVPSFSFHTQLHTLNTKS